MRPMVTFGQTPAYGCGFDVLDCKDGDLRVLYMLRSKGEGVAVIVIVAKDPDSEVTKLLVITLLVGEKELKDEEAADDVGRVEELVSPPEPPPDEVLVQDAFKKSPETI